MELTFGSVGARHAAYPRGHNTPPTPPGPRLLADRSAPSARPTLTPAQARRRVPPVPGQLPPAAFGWLSPRPGTLVRQTPALLPPSLHSGVLAGVAAHCAP